MAARLREEHEQRVCAQTNLANCNEQLQFQAVRTDEQLRTLIKDVSERDQRLQAMSSSLSWKFTRPLRWLKRLLPAGT